MARCHSCNPPIPKAEDDKDSTSCLGLKRRRVKLTQSKDGVKNAGKAEGPKPMPRKKRKRSKAQHEACTVPALSLSSAVKRNPLFVDSAPANSRPSEAEPIATGSTDEAIFYGQRTNIRRTKQKEMVSAILDLARYGEKTMGPKKKKQQSIIEKAKKLGRRRSTPLKHKSPVKKPGAFILRAPLKSRNVAREVKRFSP